MEKTSQVFIKRGYYSDFLDNPSKILEGFKKINLLSELKKGLYTAIKIHFGEKGNKSYINPSLILPVVRDLKRKGLKIFLLETNTLYHGDRMNAVDHINLAYGHGFAKLSTPIIIGDGIKGNDYMEVEVKKKHFSTCYMAAALKDIDCLFVFSHFTGHMLTGFGAAIKNLGMGCASRRGKLLQHCEVNPQISTERCVSCGLCAQNCPQDAIEKGGRNYSIIKEKCIGCAQCISICPQGAIKVIWSEAHELLGEKMAEYAFAAAKDKKCVYVNFCLYITKECDCMNKEDHGFVTDLGVLYSDDPVSIDKASIDLIIQNAGKDVLKEIHPKINYSHHLNYARDIGLGSLNYKLVDI